MWTLRPHSALSTRVLTGLAVLPLVLLAGCASEPDAPSEAAAQGSDEAPNHAQDESPDDTSADQAGTDGTGPCPAGLTAADLNQAVELGHGDVDGDGTDDEVTTGSVPDGGHACPVAVLVTTADGTSAAAVTGSTQPLRHSPLGRPVLAQLDGQGGDEIVTTVSWNPRGGGELGMFSWVDGALVQVRQGRQPWRLFATVDDGGGTPQLLSCSTGGFTAVAAPRPGGGDIGSTVTTYALRDGVVSQLQTSSDALSWHQVKADHQDLPSAGLAVFPDCG